MTDDSLSAPTLRTIRPTTSGVLQRARDLAQQELEATRVQIATWNPEQPRTILRATALEEPGTWDLRLDPPMFPPEGALLELRPGGKDSSIGTLERVAEDGQRVLARFLPTMEQHPREGETVRVDALRLLTAVADKLDAMPDPSSAARQWWGELPLDASPDAAASPPAAALSGPDLAALDVDQRAATELVLSRPAAWVIGPAGTGKTRTLVSTALAAALRGEPVLITTTTNTALDEILRRLIPLAASVGLLVGRGGDGSADLPLMGLRQVAPWELRPRRNAEGPGASAGPDPTPVPAPILATVASPRPAMATEIEAQLRLVEMRHGLPPFVGALADRVARLRRIAPHDVPSSLPSALPATPAAPVASPVRAESRGARGLPIVAATTAWLALHGDAWLSRDCVLVDEAGMIPQPMAVLVSAQAQRRVAAFGDPQQLPPVITVQDRDLATALACHPFAMAEIAPPGIDDARRQVLSFQYRMTPAVAALLSDVFYGGVLTSAAPAAETPGELAAVGLIDTSTLDTQVRANGRSRENVSQADATAALVRQIAAGVPPDHQIAVITPFTAQMRLLRQRLGTRDPRIRVTTIHQLQGGEADTVVLDLCDGPPKPGLFLREEHNPALRQLLCVALSRARQQCYVLCDEPFWRRMDGDQMGTLVQIADALRRHGVIQQPRTLDEIAWTPTGGLPGDWDCRWSAPWDESWGA